MKIAITTLGCRLNLAETEKIADQFLKRGYQISFKKPDIIVVRGCSVTQKAEKETRQKVRELRKKFKNSFIIATGCLLKNFFLPEANLILPKKKEKLIFSYLWQISNKYPPNRRFINQKIRLTTRFFLKIQDGCQKFCAYCLVPYLRGREISQPFKKIIRQIKEKEALGYREIVLTGVNIRRWYEKPAATETCKHRSVELKGNSKENIQSLGVPLQRDSEIQSSQGKIRDLVWLIKEILKETKIARIRISSLWPDKIDRKFISLFKNPRFCPHLHLSCQSLSDSLLKKMGRFYQVRKIKDKIKRIKKRFPDLTLTVDIIVGFPGETEAEFQETKKNLKELGLAKIHVFRYSSRPGTRASLMKNQISEKIKKKRATTLLHLSRTFEQKWRKKFLGKTKMVLFEQKKENFWQGLTDNYLKVFVKSQKNLFNQILPVKLEGLYKDGIIGLLRNTKPYESTKIKRDTNYE